MDLSSNHSASTDGLFYSPLGAEADLTDLVDQFVQELPERLSRMEASLQAADWPGLARTAHQLKGAAGSYGFHDLTPALLQLETQARAEAEPDALRAALEQVTTLCARVRSGTP